MDSTFIMVSLLIPLFLNGLEYLVNLCICCFIRYKKRELRKISYDEIRFDYIGLNSLYEDKISNLIRKENSFSEIRLRIAVRTKNRETAKKVVDEVETLYTNGPSGGGGVTKAIEEVVSICSIFIPREDIQIKVIYEEV